MNNKPKPRNVGPGPRVQEKPKNFLKALKKLFGYLNHFAPLIIIALLLSSLSSVFSIIGPNKLSDLTDTISKGLVIDKDKFQNLILQISNECSEDKIKMASNEILAISLDEETILKLNTSSTISKEDYQIIQQIIETKNIYLVLDLSEEVQQMLLKESIYNGITMTTSEKLEFISILQKSQSSKEEDKIKLLTQIPQNILASFFSTNEINGLEITNYEKASFIKTLGSINDFSNVNEIYKAIDASPKTIKTYLEPKMDMKKIKNISLFLLCLYGISAIFNFFDSFIMATVSNNFAKQLRSTISKKINKLPLRYFDEHETGDVLSRVTNDVDTIGMSMYQSLGSLVAAITLFIGSIIMMFITNSTMAVTAILSSIIGFALMMIILGKSQKYFLARQVELGKLNGHIEEIYTAHNIVKAYNGEKDASKTFDTLNQNVFECNKKSQFLSGLMQPIMAFIGNFSYVAVCVVGALLVMDGKITFGVIVAFMVYIRLFTSPLSQIAQGMTSLQSTAAASERVFEFIEEKEMQDETHLTKFLYPNEVEGNIEFKNVKFGYNSNKMIIKNFNCDVKKGQKIAIVGPTGAGKTTLVNLLMKFYNINAGDIKIDGVSINELPRENIHELFIMVLQDTWLFNGSIRDNIKYNKKDVTDEEIWKALKTVGVDHFVKSLPKGLDYEIKDNESISAGQKQLLTIARGMIENAPFLILDEATSSVDTRTEELVQSAMDKLTEGRTSFIIAHRLSTIKNADKILVMNEGNIIEQGNHEELMKLNGFYADLYNSQFKKSTE